MYPSLQSNTYTEPALGTKFVGSEWKSLCVSGDVLCLRLTCKHDIFRTFGPRASCGWSAIFCIHVVCLKDKLCRHDRSLRQSGNSFRSTVGCQYPHRDAFGLGRVWLIKANLTSDCRFKTLGGI